VPWSGLSGNEHYDDWVIGACQGLSGYAHISLRWAFSGEPGSGSLAQPTTWGTSLVAPGGIGSGWCEVALGAFNSV
jgi:hypothetical protein